MADEIKTDDKAVKAAAKVEELKPVESNDVTVAVEEKLPAAVKKVEKVKPVKKVNDRLSLTVSTSPTTLVSDTVTVVKNISGNRLPFGFLSAHGKELAAGATYTVQGDLMAQLSTGGGRRHLRKLAALQRAISNKILRYYVNHRHLVTVAVNDGTTIAAGDLVYLDTNNVKPASSFTWDTNLATTQASFVNVFLGVAVDSHVAGSGAVTNFRVDISPFSVYEFTCTNATHEAGALLGVKKASGNALLANQLEGAVAASAMARVVRRDGSASTTALVRVQSAYWGNNAAGAQ